MGHSRGVLANVVNSVTSGSVFITLLSATNTLIHSSDVTIILFILICAGVMLMAWYFVKNTLAVVLRRISLECRTYDKVPVSRFIFPIRVRRWCRVAADMFVLAFFKFLWNLTVIGGIIKRYSYRMVPFILAENPDLKAREAITLSRRIMKGHKWECFILDVTFWGWDILDILTLGISNVFFLNPYKICTFSEYYTELRRLGIENEIEGFEAFCDVYLYEKAPEDVLEKSYADIEELIEKNKLPIEERKGVLRFLADVFGIVLVLDDTEKQREESHERRLKISSYKDFIEGRAYPNRLFVIPEKKKVANADNIYSLKHPNAGKGITDYRQIQYQGSMVGLDRKEEKNDCDTFITSIYCI